MRQPLRGQERIRGDAERGVMMKASPAASLEVIKPQLVFQFLIVGSRKPCPSDRRALASRQPGGRGMNRRAFVTGLGAVLTVPLAAEAQQAGKVPTVGWVEAGSRSANQHFLDAFRQALRDLKYVEGQDIVIEDRWAGGQEDQFSKLN
jgi:hypothetical protein